MIIKRIYVHLRNKRYKKIWRTKNAHNLTTMKNMFFHNHCTVGTGTYGELRIIDFADPEKGSHLYIGNYCSIASDVTFVLNGEHSFHTVSTYPFRVQCLHETDYEATSKGDIHIGDDVWIGHGATILSGVNIAQGCIVAAGAVVVQDCPPYSIVGGGTGTCADISIY